MDILKYQLRSFEKIPVRIYEDNLEASKNVAKSISLTIRQKQQEGEYMVLGLATGSTPVKVYDELIRMHKKEGLSFKNVITFNLDEYYPMKKDDDQSYWKFMHENLFDHIDIDPKNIHIPNGEIPIEYVEEYCREYEEKIDALGGIDIQLLGIGRTGHIGFNEPGSWDSSRTRLVKLDHLTRQDATKSFISEEKVPYRAITMGIDTIMKAKTIYIMAFGQQKAEIVARTVEGQISSSCPATYLQKHPNTRFLVDSSAANDLTQIKTPWSVGLVNWNDELICRAIVWLAQKVGKPILKLTDEDYNTNGLSDLILEYDTAYNINIRIFNRLQHTITGWPGGKPNADDSQRPERAKPGKKRVVIFSPHPDDDVISMGGTFIRLVEQGHDVHVAYQTSGNIAVHDHDVKRFVEFIQDITHTYELDKEAVDKKYERIRNALKSKKGGEPDIALVREIKGMIRRGEARAGARIAGAKDDHIHFLDLPFYETGKVKKSPIGKEDISIIKEFLQEIKPHQIYAAGDLADPHGTHKVCLDAIFGACEQLKKESWFKDCWLWLYRGAWHEWGIDEIEMAVPLSPDEVLRKRMAIFMHQSQKDRAPFPGNDKREFWQRAEDRNSETANLYNELGLAEYEAMEAFVKWKFETNSLK
ncbi:glucosamine-6-phosphate deaminase [Membranihabitans maritimus]|uniref:glucosamine-6-phosphate deaminase n=1 Tax=Membranihabitans maritimus TaxID=2904244 RepID=UPI001F02CCE3|nr:glucosamine-6-phosphate deaminase [Membranihabitans maritimus]